MASPYFFNLHRSLLLNLCFFIFDFSYQLFHFCPYSSRWLLFFQISKGIVQEEFHAECQYSLIHQRLICMSGSVISIYSSSNMKISAWYFYLITGKILSSHGRFAEFNSLIPIKSTNQKKKTAANYNFTTVSYMVRRFFFDFIPGLFSSPASSASLFFGHSRRRIRFPHSSRSARTAILPSPRPCLPAGKKIPRAESDLQKFLP